MFVTCTCLYKDFVSIWVRSPDVEFLRIFPTGNRHNFRLQFADVPWVDNGVSVVKSIPKSMLLLNEFKIKT